MKKRPVKVSVIMPAYNTELSIDRAIKSVLAQEKVSFELLIGDDASQDKTWDKIQHYLSDSHVRTFRFSSNRGASATRNRLITKAKGQYLSFCDADDVMLPKNLFILASILDKRPAVGVAHGDLYWKPLRGRTKVKRRHMPNPPWDLFGGCFANGGTLIRRSVMKKVGGYRTQFKFLEDCDLFLRLSELTKFHYHPGKPLYLQIQSPSSLSKQPLRKQRETSRVLLRDAIQRRYGRKIRW